ncbi:hypothetical protein [Oscillibacter sp.]|uniref:hypothetical protein n=1 Tax=Oscillibacter sp. TaxID=1945593 RepID=UPI00289FF0C1|nr:hypothetical protein [Oscillibacter sp.]
MLDEKDLQAISEIMDSKLAAQKQEIMGEVQVLMESQFQPQFNLLAEGQQAILEKLVPRSRVDDLEDEVKFLKSMVRRMDDELQALKKAQ